MLSVTAIQAETAEKRAMESYLRKDALKGGRTGSSLQTAKKGSFEHDVLLKLERFDEL